VARLHKEGDKGVVDQRKMNEAKVKTLKEQQDAEVKDLKTQHQEDMKDTDAYYKDKSMHNEVVYKQALLQQRAQFEQARKRNQKAFEEGVRLKKEQFANSLRKEKLEVMKDIGKFHDRQSDPFYRMTQVQGEMTEYPNHYEIKADVPKHEKDNVKVLIKDGKVVVQGHRRFEDRVKEQGGEVSTESYQTFHEVIPLDHPVKDKLTRSHWDNGVLTVIIPKA
jgi:HSP20 family molecular chaperone IbpA